MKYRILALLIVLMTPLPKQGDCQVVQSYNILLEPGYGLSAINATLTGMGHNVTIGWLPSASYDLSIYDIIVFTGTAGVVDYFEEMVTANEDCKLGIILMNNNNVVELLGLGHNTTPGTNFFITDNTHWITEVFPLGPLDLGFTYKSGLFATGWDAIILGSVGTAGGSLVVHDTYKRVISPYYGNTYTMNANGLLLMERIIAWAADPCCNKITNVKTIKCHEYRSPSRDHLWTTSGIYYDTLTSVIECDSVLRIDLTIGDVDTSVTQNGITLQSNSLYSQYQWLDCDDNYAHISGATTNIFTANTNGRYAVRVTDGICIGTSRCYTVSSVGINQINDNTDVKLYPNPTLSGEIHIELGKTWSEVQINIKTVDGKIIKQYSTINDSDIHLQIDNPPGVYFLELISTHKTAIFKVAKH